MKLIKLIRAKKYGSAKRMVLLALLPIILVGIFLQIVWSYHNLKSGLGTHMANIAIMYHVVLLLILVGAGVSLGYQVDRMIRHKKSIFRDPKKGSWTETIMNLWGYELKDVNADPPSNTIPPIHESADLFQKPARRGRKPTFPLERWLPIALKWENRDPIRDAFTLGELISEHLGTNPDGSPIVSEQTYYSVWRQRAMDEIRQRARAKSIRQKQGPA